jgi:hypothetical protein
MLLRKGMKTRMVPGHLRPARLKSNDSASDYRFWGDLQNLILASSHKEFLLLISRTQLPEHCYKNYFYQQSKDGTNIKRPSDLVMKTFPLETCFQRGACVYSFMKHVTGSFGNSKTEP